MGTAVHTAGTGKYCMVKTIWHLSIRNLAGNGITKKTSRRRRRRLCSGRGKKCGGNAGKAIPGKLRYMTGRQEPAALCAPVLLTGIRLFRGNQTLQRITRSLQQNGITREMWGLHRNRSGRFRQERSGGSAGMATTGSVQSRYVRKEQAVRSVTGGSISSRG